MTVYNILNAGLSLPKVYSLMIKDRMVVLTFPQKDRAVGFVCVFLDCIIFKYNINKSSNIACMC